MQPSQECVNDHGEQEWGERATLRDATAHREELPTSTSQDNLLEVSTVKIFRGIQELVRGADVLEHRPHKLMVDHREGSLEIEEHHGSPREVQGCNSGFKLNVKDVGKHAATPQEASLCCRHAWCIQGFDRDPIRTSQESIVGVDNAERPCGIAAVHLLAPDKNGDRFLRQTAHVRKVEVRRLLGVVGLQGRGGSEQDFGRVGVEAVGRVWDAVRAWRRIVRRLDCEVDIIKSKAPLGITDVNPDIFVEPLFEPARIKFVTIKKKT